VKSLVVEDDYTSRFLLQTVLSRFGECHIAVNGLEAIQAVEASQKLAAPYDFICMDIMMPEMDGQQALRRIRDLELQSGTVSTNGAKIVMTTALDQPREVFAAFYELCDDYLVKPIDTHRLIDILHEHRLISD
jgi:two-component system chemotaxis response regulator CheY